MSVCIHSTSADVSSLASLSYNTCKLLQLLYALPGGDILQEAPLTLRGQRGRCGNIKKEPQIYGSFPSPRRRPRDYDLACGFMVGLGKPRLCTKFEVASFSHCENIKRKPPNIAELP